MWSDLGALWGCVVSSVKRHVLLRQCYLLPFLISLLLLSTKQSWLHLTDLNFSVHFSRSAPAAVGLKLHVLISTYKLIWRACTLYIWDRMEYTVVSESLCFFVHVATLAQRRQLGHTTLVVRMTVVYDQRRIRSEAVIRSF